jgi:phage-associated protein|nr:MAG TPA: hypothetical protein [Caudoviricetes sp.]
MRDALIIAYFLIRLAGDRGLSNLKIQKMLYFIQRELIRHNFAPFNGRMEAWKFGPVFPEVYYEFSGGGSLPIIFNNLNTDIGNRVDNLDGDIVEIARRVFNERRDQDVWEMVEETHQSNGAWERVFKDPYRNVITIDDIRREVLN